MNGANKMPGWLAVLLVMVAMVVLGPPALALMAGALGVTIALAAVALKLGVVVLVIYAVVALLRAMFGQRSAKEPSLPPGRGSLEVVESRLDADEREHRAALDRELEAAIRTAR